MWVGLFILQWRLAPDATSLGDVLWLGALASPIVAAVGFVMALVSRFRNGGWVSNLGLVVSVTALIVIPLILRSFMLGG